ncbi:MAG: hypothetical protein WCK65_07805, partial [Rhodospirillaceae bacterium]
DMRDSVVHHSLPRPETVRGKHGRELLAFLYGCGVDTIDLGPGEALTIHRVARLACHHGWRRNHRLVD